MKVKLIIIFLVVLFSCDSQYSKPLFVATNNPLAEILREVVGTRGEVMNLLDANQSPHTYSPKPSDAFRVQSALALFYVSEELDAWATTMDSKNRIKVIDLIPAENLYPFERTRKR